MSQTRHIEARVGAFVLLGVGILAGFILLLSDLSLEPRLRLQADFGYSGALKVGAPVLLSGVRVGQVADLSILAPGSGAAPVEALGRREPAVVRAALEVERSVTERLSDDTQFYVGMQGLIGEAYVEVDPGTSATPLDVSAAVRGTDAPKLHVMILRFSSTLGTLSRVVGATSSDDFSRVGASIASIVDSLDSLLSERRDQIRTALDDLAGAASELRDLVTALDAAVGDGEALAGLLRDGREVARTLKVGLPSLLERANSAAESIEGLSVRLEQAADPKSVAETLAKVREAAQRLSDVTEDARILTQSLRRGEGTLGGLLRDPTVYEDVKELLRELKRNPWKLLWRE